jgi:hypothetical protein
MDQLNTDQIEDAAIEMAPPADEPTVIATTAELTAWRASPVRRPGDLFAYFASSSSLMRERSRSVAAEEIAMTVWHQLHLTGKGACVQRRNGGITEYIVQATDTAPVQAVAVAQPQPKSKVRSP